MGILSLILNFLGGGLVQSLADAYKAKQQAATDQEKIAADERINRINAMRDVQKAEAGSRINAIIRAMFALPVAVYFGKLYLWDKVLGWGRTDALSPELWQVAMVIIGFYFLAETATSVTRIAKRK